MVKGVRSIGLIKNVLESFKPVDSSIDLVPITDWEYIGEAYHDTHLRQSALDTVIGRIKSACELATFMTSDSNLDYLINVRPNENENALEFRDKYIERLLMDGEALIVRLNNHFYVAESFSYDDAVTRPKRYNDVIIENMEVHRPLYSGDVLHIKYQNSNLKRFLQELDDSYGRLFNRLIEVHMRNNQIRIYAKFGTLSSKDKASQEKFAKFLKGFEDKVRNDSVVVAPSQNDYEIQEQAQHYESRSVTEVNDLENMYLARVANTFQMSPLLFSGDLADVSQHTDNFIKFAVRPILEKLASELNGKWFTKTQAQKGERVTVNIANLIYNSEFEMAGAVEKMIGSGRWTIDEILILQGKKPIGDKLTTQRYLTKNLAPLNEDGTVQV